MKTFCTLDYDSEVRPIYTGYPDSVLIGYYRPARLRGYQDLIESKQKTEEVFTKTIPKEPYPVNTPLKNGIGNHNIYIEFKDDYKISEQREQFLNQFLV